jgi:hypothetical protein
MRWLCRRFRCYVDHNPTPTIPVKPSLRKQYGLLDLLHRLDLVEGAVMDDNALSRVLVACRYVAIAWVVTLTGRGLASWDIWIDGHHGAEWVEHIAEGKPTPAFDDVAPVKA